MRVPKTLQQAIQLFSDYENCREFMVELRWPDGVIRCPYCGRPDPKYLEKARLYCCYGKHDRRKFSLKVGTVFEDSPIPLDKWLPVVWMLANCKNGVSSYEIHRAIGVTQKTAWFMLHRIRKAMQNRSFRKLGSDGGPVEADETRIGPNPHRMHASRRRKLQTGIGAGGGYTKAMVMGLLERDTRQVRAKVVPNVKRETLQDEILKQVAKGARIYTDEHVGYDGLEAEEFIHETVCHVDAYVRGEVHTQGMENFWSLLKRGLKGTYVAVEPFHLSRYVDEQVFRYNNRRTKENPVDDGDRFMLAVSQIVGQRLTYAELTGKEEGARA